MNDKEFCALGAYVRHCADVLELRDWTILLERQAVVDDDVEAHITPLFGRRFASLRVSADFRDRDADLQRYVVGHELVHCHLERLDDLVNNGVQATVGEPVWGLFYAQFRVALEHSTDGVASVVQHQLPFIDWTYEPKLTASYEPGTDLRLHPWRPDFDVA